MPETCSIDKEKAKESFQKITLNIERVMRGQSLAIRRLLTAIVSGGHVLLEDCPGTGKTTLAKALALSVDARFKRIQFTPDLLPSDITGVSIFDQQKQAFDFHEGPLFANIVLADEINRASPRTQSALLEAMAEGQVSVDGKVIQLEELFFVIATQNPIESSGTYPLPEAQMDRFAFQFSLGYVPPEEEVAILSGQEKRHPIEDISACLTRDEILSLREMAKEVRVSDELKRYIVDLVRASREKESVRLGASPRASLALMKSSQALALLDGLEYVTPDHIQELSTPVLAHRLVLDSQAKFSGMSSKSIVEDIVREVAVPV